MKSYNNIKRLQSNVVKNIKEFDAMAHGQAKGFDKIGKRVEKLENNSFLISLDADGVRRWERIYGLDALGTLEMRRDAIIAYRRGKSKLSSSIIKNIAIAYQNGEVDIWFDKEKSTLMVKFVSQYGIPNGLEKLQEILEELKPARLAIEYILSYLTWNEFDNYNKTWNEWDNLNLTWDEFETYREVI